MVHRHVEESPTRIQNIKAVINDIESEYDEGVPIDVVERAVEVDVTRLKAENEIDQLKRNVKVYEPVPTRFEPF